MTPEGRIVAYLVERCKALGFEQRKLAYEGKIGAPDRMIWRHGVLAFVEIKAPGQAPRAHQIRELTKLSISGCPVAVVSSKEEVDNFLSKLLWQSTR